MKQFDTSPEFAPLSGIDEYLIHNSPQPQRLMYTSDPRAFERTWFTAQDKVGDLFIVCGMGFYPNLDTADGYAIIVYRGKLSYVRYHRRLGLNRMDMRFGPLGWEIIEPFKTWKLTLGDNPFGIRYELFWHDTKRPMFSDLTHSYPNPTMMPGFASSMIRPNEHVGYESFGAVEGWAEVNGERFELTVATYSGSRDHHWGVRNGTGGIGAPLSFAEHAGQWVEFKDWSIWGGKNLRPLGSDLPGAGRFFTANRRLKFDPDTGEFREGVITLIDEAGLEKELHYRRLGFQTAYLRCGGYGASTPDGGGIHGVYPGEDKLFGGAFDLMDAAVRTRLGDLVDHHCEVSCGSETTYGMFECVEPLLKGLCEKNKAGFQLLK